jgi:farnesyl-diphosphate farnesyltransferase
MVIEADLAFQKEILHGVSRTFALTIPQLPQPLDVVVGNAYLLCRITDTIEDTPVLSFEQRQTLHTALIQEMRTGGDGEALAEKLSQALLHHDSSDERLLLAQLPSVLRMTRTFNANQQAAILRCLEIMGEGMLEFEGLDLEEGLPNLASLDRYCYVVAGVVGEMLTELFCEQSPDIAKQGDFLRARSVSYGQGLQMTNILKDIHTDMARGICWLPRDLFEQHGCEGTTMRERLAHPNAPLAIAELVDKATHHLQDAVDYTLAIPTSERGLRRFNLWAIGMAILTLRNIRKKPFFKEADEVKITRRAVKMTIWTTNRLIRSNTLLRLLLSRLNAQNRGEQR